MGIKITPPSEPIQVKNVIVTIYGSPGSGKTSLGYTANEALLADFDGGSYRAYDRRSGTVQVSVWNNISKITIEELKKHKTIVIDTAGNMIEKIILHIEQTMPEKSKDNRQLYSEVKNIFNLFIAKIKAAELDLVYLCHYVEEKKGEQTTTRIEVAGKAKNIIYQSSDLLGFLSDEDNVRILNFNPVDGRIAKNTGKFEPINLTKENVTLADIIQQLKDKINTLSAEQQKAQELEKVKQEQIKSAIEVIDGCKTTEDFNSLLDVPFMIETPQIKLHLSTKAKDNGLVYNKETKLYENKVVE